MSNCSVSVNVFIGNCREILNMAVDKGGLVFIRGIGVEHLMIVAKKASVKGKEEVNIDVFEANIRSYLSRITRGHFINVALGNGRVVSMYTAVEETKHRDSAIYTDSDNIYPLADEIVECFSKFLGNKGIILINEDSDDYQLKNKCGIYGSDSRALSEMVQGILNSKLVK